MVTMRELVLIMASVATLSFGCGGETPAPKPAPAPAPEPEPTEPPGPEKVEVDNKCVSAMGVCDGGVCSIDVKNDCEAAVTCELEAMALCRTEVANGEARGKGRDTVAPGASMKIQAGADCEGAQVVATQVVSLSCK